MKSLIPAVNDLTVIIFDLIIFTKLIFLKRDTWPVRLFMYLGCALIVAGYYVAVYILDRPAALSSMICMSIPSMVLFFILSKHKDSRFIMTFCFVDSVTLMIAFIGRYIGVIVSDAAGVVSVAVIVVLFSTILAVGKNYLKKYHDLLDTVDTGWREMAVSTALIYFALVFFAAYPKPMIERVEYAPVYLVFSAVVVSFFVVFVKSIVKTRQINEQNKRLEHEKSIYRIAYMDALTGLYNQASYIEAVNTMERRRNEPEYHGDLFCVMLDINKMKQINDQRGHHAGDRALIGAAAALRRAFEREGAYLFRLGGDEFCVLMTDSSKLEAESRLAVLKQELRAESREAGFPICLAAGYVLLGKQDEETVEEALNRADQKMYEDKNR